MKHRVQDMISNLKYSFKNEINADIIGYGQPLFQVLILQKKLDDLDLDL